jgi:DNA-binding transcriptional LysR family regulator
LTEAGRALLRGAAPAFEQLNEAVEAAQTTGHAARGSLKLAMAEHVYVLYVGPALPAFARAYPEIEIELSLTDALADVLDEGLHAGLRLGDRISQDMIAVRVTPPLELAVVGSPAYFGDRAAPQRPEDLLDHACIRYRFPSSGQIAPWMFHIDEAEAEVLVGGQVILNTLPATINLAKQGLGLAYTFTDYCAPDLASGALQTVLSEYLPKTPGVFAYFPREYRTMLPLRLFLDHIKASQNVWR